MTYVIVSVKLYLVIDLISAHYRAKDCLCILVCQSYLASTTGRVIWAVLEGLGEIGSGLLLLMNELGSLICLGMADPVHGTSVYSIF